MASRIVGLTEFMDGLSRAAHGVVRVRATAGSSAGLAAGCTGWLITESLVAIPAGLLISQQFDNIRCYRADHPEVEIQASVAVVSAADADYSLALLRLYEPPAGGAALPLAPDDPQDREPVVLLHYPWSQEEASVSFGRVKGVKRSMFLHDAETVGGSGGAPVLDVQGRVLGMDMGRFVPTVGGILTVLRESVVWPEIGERHNLVDVAAVRRVVDGHTDRRPVDGRWALALAVRWSVDPQTLPPGDRDRVAGLVNDPRAARWTMRSAERQRLIGAAGSLDALRAARGTEPADDGRQQVIDRILAGPPYSLDKIDEAVLPHWLQAVRWFAPAVPELPTAADIHRTLERRRLRSRLTAIAGAGFRGRTDELFRLWAWYTQDSAEPLVVSGIGGIGKSALAARFAGELPEETLVCWLDFDRADLAPDDADSVLARLGEQIASQVDGFAPEPVADGTPWRMRAEALAEAFARACADRQPPLLVLDGFEVAQHVPRHGEIWAVLDVVLAHVPDTRVLVSGRAPVRDLTLQGRPGRPLPLGGLDREDAIRWLRDTGVTNPEVLNRVVTVARGVPLVLRLAARLVESGDSIDDLPETLPVALVEGFLYRRILDRVLDTELTLIAADALVLRRLTVDIIATVLADRIPEELDAAETFDRLSRELGLVTDEAVDEAHVTIGGDPGVLRVRPEVRGATLALLERDNADRVRVVDERAVAWYAGQDPDDVVVAAELVYHRLRLGDLAGAGRAWHDACAPLLLDADNEMREPARGWLQSRLRGPSSGSTDMAIWERDALLRIRSALARGLDRVVGDILAERTGRSAASPLILYDAWLRAQTGDLPHARRMLAEAGFGDGPVGRDRSVLAALLAVRSGDRPEADRLLAPLTDTERWPSGEVTLALAAWAARVRLTVDLAAERELADKLDNSGRLDWFEKVLFLKPTDVVHPTLARMLGMGEYTNRLRPLPVPVDRSELAGFMEELDRRRLAVGSATPADPFALWRRPWSRPDEPWSTTDPRLGLREIAAGGDEPRVTQSVRDVPLLGVRRWHLAATSLALGRACAEALQTERIGDRLTVAIGATLAVFRSIPLTVNHQGVTFEDFDQVIDAMSKRHPTRPFDPDDSLDSLLAVDDLDWSNALYVYGPDPLEVLFDRVAGLPEWDPR